MPKFGKTSRNRLEQAHVDIELVCNEAVSIIDFSVLCTFRNQQEQNRAYDKGYSKVIWPNGKHNIKPSHAVDVAPYYSEKPHIRWPVVPDQKLTKKIYEKKLAKYIKEVAMFYSLGSILVTIAKSYNIKWRWGADWDSDWDFMDQNFDDIAHHELLP